jgi:hypothetical protein
MPVGIRTFAEHFLVFFRAPVGPPQFMGRIEMLFAGEVNHTSPNKIWAKITPFTGEKQGQSIPVCNSGT